MLISRCCNTPVQKEWVGLLLTKEALICSGCGKEVEYSDCVMVKTK
jgi:hypothetical protein